MPGVPDRGLEQELAILGGVIAAVLAAAPAWCAAPRPQAQEHSTATPLEYTFQVPVRVTGVERWLVDGFVRCEVRAVFEQTRDNHSSDPQHEFFRGDSKPFLLRSGGFDGTVPVQVFVTKNIVGEAGYSCSLHFRLADGTDTTECAADDKKMHVISCSVAPWARVDEERRVMLVQDKLATPKAAGQ